MTAIFSSLGYVKDYTPTQPNIFSINWLQKRRHAPSFQCYFLLKNLFYQQLPWNPI